jgi:hypothetical protein
VLASEEVVEGMPFVTCHMSISLDGFVAGPHQSADNPLGIDGRQLHDWHLNEPKHPVDEAFTQRLLGPRGALGGGKTLFPSDGEARGFELISAKTAATGVQVCRYHPAR